MDDKKSLPENIDNKEFNDIKHLFLKTANYNLTDLPKADGDTVVIYPPTIDWNWMRQRPQQLMEQFSLHGFPVYYCNMTQSKFELFTAVNSNLTIVHNNHYFIKHVVPLLKAQGKKILLWVSWSKLHYFMDEYQPDFVIYDYLDDFSAWQSYLKPMVDKADVVITTSQVLEAQAQTQFPDKPRFLIPNGCDVEHFKGGITSKKPPEFASHTGPIITYSGAWAKWIDHALVEKIAAAFPSALVAIIGVEFGAKVNREIPNLKYLGYKSYLDLPSYLHHSTVCIIPFLIEQITVATNPIKMYEYLASGKPVVSTDIPEARLIPAVYVGADHNTFIEAIRQLIEKKATFSEEEVTSWLSANTWEKRFEEILPILKSNGLC